MAQLEDKILKGKNVGYCSSSEEEDEHGPQLVSDDDERQVAVMRGIRNTGPKGVLDDWRFFRNEQKQQQEAKLQNVIAEAKRGMLSGNEGVDEELQRIREERLQQLKDRITSKGKVIEMETKEQFLSAIEKCRNALLLIHIYEESVDGCITMNSVLCSVAAKYPQVKLARVKSSVLKTSATFSSNALPTLQVYYNDALVGNFVRITDQLGEDFTTSQLIAFLYDGRERMDEERYLYAPLGLMFITMGENHEQVSFTYPFSYDHSSTRSDPDHPSSPERGTYPQKESDRSDAQLYGVPTAILAHLLSAKGMCDAPFEIKIDNFRFAGFPKMVSNPTARSPHIFHVVFVLVANAPAYLVNSFQTLSRKVALAIDEEQSRCGYLADQMTTMLNEHDKNESLPNAEDSFPYREILDQSSLAQELRDVFDDVSDYGMVHVFINDCVEIGFCIETRAHIHTGLTPKSRTEVEAIVRKIRPYHGILLLEDSIPSPDSNPSVRLLLKHCEPDRSIIGVSNASGLPVVQVLLVVRHLLLWARAVIIYPLCSSNVYTSATHPKPLTSLAEQFAELFDNAELAAVLAEFSPPCTLAEFTNASLHSIEEQRVRLRMVARLLRDELIMQLHTFLYLLPPFSNDSTDMSELKSIADEGIKQMIMSAQMTNEIKGTVGKLCSSLLRNSTSEQVESTLALFIRLLPYLNGEHHIEDIMYRMNLERSVIVRVLDTFASVLATFSRPDFINE